VAGVEQVNPEDKTEQGGDEWQKLSGVEQVERHTEAFPSQPGPDEPDSQRIIVTERNQSLFAPDQSISRYRLIRQLGAGSFAEVWLALEDGSHGFRKEVALKILKRERADEETVVALQDEARVCGLLHHPHLVDVYGVGSSDGVAFIAMEYIRGTTLALLLHRLRKANLKLPLAVTLDIGIQVCQGLDYAHTATDHDGNALHLVHRDLKPANLMLSQGSGVKIADFGLAKASTTSQSTEVGTLRGTPGYIAPEIWAGSRDFGPQVDMFAVGAILWEMAVGASLFKGTLPEVIGAAMHGDIEEEIQRLKLHQPELQSVVRRLLQRDPEQRTRTAWDAQTKLEELRRGCDSPGGLDLFLSLFKNASGELTSEKARRATDSLKASTDPRWRQLLETDSLALQFDTAQVERRVSPAANKATPAADRPATTRRMTPPGLADDDTIDLGRRHVKQAGMDDRIAGEEPISRGSGTLWRTGVANGRPAGPVRNLVLATLSVVVVAAALFVLYGRDQGPEQGASALEEAQPPAAAAQAAQAVTPAQAAQAATPAEETQAAAPAEDAKPEATERTKEKRRSEREARAKKARAAAKTATPQGVQTDTSTATSHGCLVFRSEPIGAEVQVGSKSSGVASRRNKPLSLPVGRAAITMSAVGQQAAIEVRVRAGKLSTVSCSFMTSRPECRISTSNAACP